ncbi:MAG: helical backbone metal receptor [Deltaproteobacteria bacterium]|jgi:ABC-type Fe3+-hydroxamate transport system substrate-binding protein
MLDAMGRQLRLGGPARRVVSLVPSETEAVVLLGCADRLVGRTDYCVEPRGAIEHVARVGGTKDARVEEIVALAPDLVLANQEENTPRIVRALEDASIPTHVSFPKTVEDAASLVRDLATLLGLDPRRCEAITQMERDIEEARVRRAARAPLRVFCPIWRDPLMTIRGDTFLSDALDLAGASNVFSDRARRYPLAADLGQAAPKAEERWTGRDTRYPRVTLDEVLARSPDLVVLPDEPHPFDDADAELFRARGLRVVFVSGRDLSWYSPRMGRGVLAIAARLDAARP